MSRFWTRVDELESKGWTKLIVFVFALMAPLLGGLSLLSTSDFGWLKVYKSGLANGDTTIFDNAPTLQIGLVRYCTQNTIDSHCTVSFNPIIADDVFGNMTEAPIYLLKAPKGNPAITLITGISLSALFNTLGYLALFPNQCCGGRTLRDKTGRRFLSVLGSLSVAFIGASAVLSQVLFSTIAKMFNNSVRFDHPEVQLYATTGLSYPMALCSVILVGVPTFLLLISVGMSDEPLEQVQDPEQTIMDDPDEVAHMFARLASWLRRKANKNKYHFGFNPDKDSE